MLYPTLHPDPQRLTRCHTAGITLDENHAALFLQAGRDKGGFQRVQIQDHRHLRPQAGRYGKGYRPGPIRERL